MGWTSGFLKITETSSAQGDLLFLFHKSETTILNTLQTLWFLLLALFIQGLSYQNVYW